MIPIADAQNSLSIHKEQRLNLLSYMDYLDFLSLIQIACFNYSFSSSSMNQARRWAKKAVEDGLILERRTQKLGRVFVLAKGGVDYLWEHSDTDTIEGYAKYPPKSGKDWGKKGLGKWWIPPANAVHTHMANLSMCWLEKFAYFKELEDSVPGGQYITTHKHKNGGPCIEHDTEKLIRSINPKRKKIPDGAVLFEDANYYVLLMSIETENERKSGHNMRSLAQSIINTYQEHPPLNFKSGQLDVFSTIVVCPETSIDRRTGHRINHTLRIQNAMEKLTKDIIPVDFLLYTPPKTEGSPSDFFKIKGALINGKIVELFYQITNNELILDQIEYQLEDMTDAYGKTVPTWEWRLEQCEDYEIYGNYRFVGTKPSKNEAIVALMQKLEEQYPKLHEGIKLLNALGSK